MDTTFNDTDEHPLFHIRKAKEEDWDDAMELAFRIFLKYEADEYGKEGTDHFASFVTDNTLKKMFLLGEYRLFLAERKKEIIGLISTRNGNHISLLFVDDRYHRRGIGSALIGYLVNFLKFTTDFHKVTVNAAPYGIPFYHTIGFKDMGPLEKKDGISFVPMELYLNSVATDNEK